MDARRRALLWAILVAVAVGFAAGWFARVVWQPARADRAHEAFEHMRERAREVTR